MTSSAASGPSRSRAALGNIVVENRAGGGSSIALNYVAQQPADGHTLLVGSTSTLVLREGSNNKAYDALKEIAAISILATTSTSIAVNPSLPVKSVKELIAYLKANPGKLSYGSGGVGAITHITPELFKQQAGGLDMLHVPYRGVGAGDERPARRADPGDLPEHHRRGGGRCTAAASCACSRSTRRSGSRRRPTFRRRTKKA